MIKSSDIEELERALVYRKAKASNDNDRNIFAELLYYVNKAVKILFIDGQYKGIKWYQIPRWVAIAKIAVDLLLHLVELFKDKKD